MVVGEEVVVEVEALFLVGDVDDVLGMMSLLQFHSMS